jgi:hypothetical protein
MGVQVPLSSLIDLCRMMKLPIQFKAGSQATAIEGRRFIG